MHIRHRQWSIRRLCLNKYWRMLHFLIHDIWGQVRAICAKTNAISASLHNLSPQIFICQTMPCFQACGSIRKDNFSKCYYITLPILFSFAHVKWDIAIIICTVPSCDDGLTERDLNITAGGISPRASATDQVWSLGAWGWSHIFSIHTRHMSRVHG